MKLIKRLLILFMAFLFCHEVSFADTEVTLDLTNEINKDIIGVMPGTENSTIEHCHFKLTSNNKIAYCSDGHSKIPKGEKDAVWKNCQTLTGPNSISLAYIYEYGYGNYKEGYSSNDYLVGGNKYTDYFITQAAVWRYTIEPQWLTTFISNNYTYNGTTNEATRKIKKLIEDSLAAQEGPSLSISNDENMSLDIVGDYYVSKGIIISGKYINSQIKVNVTGPTGVFVTNKINAQKGASSFDNESTIYVKIPISSVDGMENIAFSITTSATSAIGEGRIQECTYSGTNTNKIQNMIIYNQQNEELTKKSQYNINTTKVKISKKDNNEQSLEGATLTIKQGSSEIYSWTSMTESQILYLLPGNYTLIETATPDGYVVNKEEIEFEVKADGTIILDNKIIEEIEIVNKPINITVSKRKIKQETELSGAKLRITDKEGNIAKDLDGNSLEWISSDEPKTFHVIAGTYILEEISAPTGYELSHKKIEFTVNKDGTVTTKDGTLVKKDKIIENNIIIFENTPEPDYVPTGSAVIYISIMVGMIAIGTAVFLILKNSKK